jgi:hypothetical protein
MRRTQGEPDTDMVDKTLLKELGASEEPEANGPAWVGAQPGVVRNKLPPLTKTPRSKLLSASKSLAAGEAQSGKLAKPVCLKSLTPGWPRHDPFEEYHSKHLEMKSSGFLDFM